MDIEIENNSLVIAHVKIQFEINSQRKFQAGVFWNLVIAHVKIQFEINSQQVGGMHWDLLTCDCSRKNTIWNQFTTQCKR